MFHVKHKTTHPDQMFHVEQLGLSALFYFFSLFHVKQLLFPNAEAGEDHSKQIVWQHLPRNFTNLITSETQLLRC